MIEIERPNIITVDLSEDGKHGTFVIEPLERGYGITLGNSLRRVLLSSLPGVAATSVKIEGVLHEISTVPGVKEDVTEIVLNVKGIVARLYSQTPKTVVIKARNAGEITAGDIVVDSDIEILNPSHHIATLEDGAEFYMEITFDHGRGYVSSEKNKQMNTSVIGLIYTDSIYTPVYNVNFKVENTRVGNITDYDKLTIDLTTNGTINAKEAVSLAAKILSEHLNLFIELSDEAKNTEIMVDRIKEKRMAGEFAYEEQALRNHLSAEKCTEFLLKNMRANGISVPMHVHVDKEAPNDSHRENPPGGGQKAGGIAG